MRQDKEVYERLGPAGLARVLDDVLDKARLVKLANACGLKYPGMRARSQTREKLLQDLVGRVEEQAKARTAVLRLLRKETRADARRWSGLAPEDKAAQLADSEGLLARRQLGHHLFILACGVGEKDTEDFEAILARQHLLQLAANGNSRPEPSKPSREESRLQKKIGELAKKVTHLEGQLARSKDVERAAKRELAERKGELAEARLLSERLRGELVAMTATAGQTVAARRQVAADADSVQRIHAVLQKLTQEHKRLGQRLDKFPSTLPAAKPPESALAPIVTVVDKLRADLEELREQARREQEERDRKLDELRAEIVKSTASGKPLRRKRPRAGSERVGVFIDVQNMFYGARQLKGKLDFDALLEAAVRGRRLVQPTAYVVESNEIDQSGFIAMLQKRAIEVRRKQLRVRADGSMKGDWDMELALDILDAVHRLDVVVLVSGDGDFTSLVKRVRQMGPRVEVLGFPRTTAKSLVEAADDYTPLNRKFMIYKRRKKKDVDPTHQAAAAAAAPPVPPKPAS